MSYFLRLFVLSSHIPRHTHIPKRCQDLFIFHNQHLFTIPLRSGLSPLSIPIRNNPETIKQTRDFGKDIHFTRQKACPSLFELFVLSSHVSRCTHIQRRGHKPPSIPRPIDYTHNNTNNQYEITHT
jgi:hypothetical protein